LVQDLWRVDPGEARRLVRQARALFPPCSPSGSPVQPRLAATAPVAAAGALDRGHVRVIDEAVRYLERVDGIDPAALEEAEAFLAEKAAVLAPRGLARVAAQLIAALDPDGVAPEEDSESGDELRVGRRRDGSLVLKGQFRGRADCQLILAAFDALSGRAGAEDERSLEARYAATLLELCGLAMAPGGIGATAPREDRADPRETTAPAERGQGDPRHLSRDQRHPDDAARE
jgi:5-methylcytosine-specific restriction protein A